MLLKCVGSPFRSKTSAQISVHTFPCGDRGTNAICVCECTTNLQLKIRILKLWVMIQLGASRIVLKNYLTRSYIQLEGNFPHVHSLILIIPVNEITEDSCKFVLFFFWGGGGAVSQCLRIPTLGTSLSCSRYLLDGLELQNGHLRQFTICDVHRTSQQQSAALKLGGYCPYHLLLCVPYGSHNKQQLFPKTALTGWAL
jgi:hypothetical protein